MDNAIQPNAASACPSEGTANPHRPVRRDGETEDIEDMTTDLAKEIIGDYTSGDSWTLKFKTCMYMGMPTIS